jgi:RNA polymerase sigma-70 factor (ECF subfamily)
MGDNALSAACIEGDLGEFREIVDAHKAAVMALAVNILGNFQDAEDACQETFIQVYKNLESFDPRKSFKNWIFTILYRRCLDQLRKQRRFQSAFHRAKHELPGDIPAKGSDPGKTKFISRDVLDRLSPRERAVLVLWANEGYTAAEISKIIPCSPSTARVYLFNARKKIKSYLEKSHAAL